MKNKPITEAAMDFSFRKLEDRPTQPMLSQKCIAYIDSLIHMEGFGETRTDVIERFVWNEINRLIAIGRLKELT